MDLGLRDKSAIVCGSSAGMGLGCAHALASAGARVVINGRTESRLLSAAERLRLETGAEVIAVVADVRDPDGRRRILEQCPQPDILVNNSAGPPAGDFLDFDESDWMDAVSATMIAPIMMIRSVIEGMSERGWGRIVNITSSSVKAPLPLLGLSNGGRSGLTGFVAGLARERAITGVTINNVLPGRIETDRLTRYLQDIATSRGVEFETAAGSFTASNPMKRFGTIEEIGAVCAFLCSVNAGYITGQNILVDGGEFPGL